jgi:hypothetical protein
MLRTCYGGEGLDKSSSGQSALRSIKPKPVRSVYHPTDRPTDDLPARALSESVISESWTQANHFRSLFIVEFSLIKYSQVSALRPHRFYPSASLVSRA